MPFSVINLRIDERERERERYKIFPSRERRGEKKRKKNLSFRAACCSIFVTSAVCISARFPSSRQPFFPFREYACSSTTVVSISRPELGCKILEALALKYLWRCTHLRLLILRHHPSSTPSSSLFRSLPDRFSSISSFCSSPPVSSFVWPPFLHPSSSSSSSHLIENRARERELIRGPRDSRENEVHPLHQSRLISIRYLAILAWLARFRGGGRFGARC